MPCLLNWILVASETFDSMLFLLPLKLSTRPLQGFNSAPTVVDIFLWLVVFFKVF